MIREGDAVRVSGGQKSGRPGVVLRLLPNGKLFVPWGTGTNRPNLASVVIEPRSAAGVALGVYKTTYFYRDKVTICSEDHVEALPTRCPPNVFHEIKALYGL